MPQARDARGRHTGPGTVAAYGGGLTINFSVFGDVQLSRTLLRVSDRARDMRPVFADLADRFLQIEREQFESDGGFSGHWAPLADSTVARKARQGLDPRILRATLALERSLTRRGAPGARRRVGKSTLFVGSGVTSDKGFPYPAVHQNPVLSHVPRRRPVELDEVNRRDWMRRMQRYIVAGQGAAGYR